MSYSKLFDAVRGGDEDALRKIVAAGGSLHVRGERGRTAVHVAAEAGNDLVLKILYAFGANLHTKDAKGWTAAHIAAVAGRSSTLKLLDSMGADCLAKDGEGRTPLDLAQANNTGAATTLQDMAIAIQGVAGLNFDVFICHQQEDAQEFCLSLRDHLMTSGRSVFFDPRMVDQMVIVSDIVEGCRAFVLVLSRNVFESHWCLLQLHLAVKYGVPVVPIIMEGSTWGEAMSPDPHGEYVPSKVTVNGITFEPRVDLDKAFQVQPLRHTRANMSGLVDQLLRVLPPTEKEAAAAAAAAEEEEKKEEAPGIPDVNHHRRPLTREEAKSMSHGTKVFLLERYERGTPVDKGTVGTKTGFNEDTGNVVVTFGSRTGACPKPEQVSLYHGSRSSGEKAEEGAAAVPPPVDVLGGFHVGQAIFSAITFSGNTGKLEPGFKGVVKGPSDTNDPERILCHFDSGVRINIKPSEISAEDPTLHPLPGGFQIGQTIYSTICFSGSTGQLEPGYKGVVKGPSDSNDPDRLLCHFDSGVRINIKPNEISAEDPTLQSLPGGFQIGQTIYSRIVFSGSTGQLEPGFKGVVKGPADSGDPERLYCHFDSGVRINIKPSEIAAEDPTVDPLPGGFQIGQTIYSRTSFTGSTGTIEPGSKGVVKGPADSGDRDRLLCHFDSGVRINIKPSEISSEDPTLQALPGGFQIGQTIYSTITFRGNTGELEPGFKGVVKGPADSGDLERLYCHFDSGVRINIKPNEISAEDPTLKPIPGGFHRDQVVYSTIHFSGSTGTLTPGSRGVVRGPASTGDAARLYCAFDNGVRINILPSEISSANNQ